MSVLTEVYIQDCFHSYLRSSLAQAKAERLLDVDVLASAEADLMITGAHIHRPPFLVDVSDDSDSFESLEIYPGPALTLYFAAIRSTTTPPSVPLPRLDKTQPPAELSATNCPPAYAPFLRLWSEAVGPIQSLAPEHQHDLARLICGLEPVTNSSPRELTRLAADLRAVAIEISQRRTFQERYGSDLQAAIDSGSASASPAVQPTTNGEGSSRRRVASFRPPPAYDETPTPSTASPHVSPHPSPAGVNKHLPPVPEATQPLNIRPRTPTSPHEPTSPGGGVGGFQIPPPLDGGAYPAFAPDPGAPPFPMPEIPGVGAPAAPGAHRRTPSAGPGAIGNTPSTHRRTQSATSTSSIGHPSPQSPGLLSPTWSYTTHAVPPSPSSSQKVPRSPTLLPAHAPAIELIRETLYASLADVLGQHPSLRQQAAAGDRSRAYFGAVALAILSVSTSRVTPTGGVLGVLGAELSLEACPPPLRPLMAELAAIGSAFKGWEEEDSERAVDALVHGHEPPRPGADRVKEILEKGAGYAEAHQDGRPRSAEGRALALANRINGLALRMTQLRPFRERQEEVFKVLVGVID
jgi:hypothetical protein